MDGITHESELAQIKDQKRDQDLILLGFTTLLFASWEVLNRIEDVSMIIGDWITKHAKAPPPGPRQRGN